MDVESGGTDPVRWWTTEDWCDPFPWEIPSPDWAGWEASYDNDCEYRKQTTRQFEAFYGMPELIARLGSNMVAVESMLNRRLYHDPLCHGGGLHVIRPGGYLSTHLDYDRHPKIPEMRRAINLILFLNREWKEEWGGAFVLTDPMGNVKKRIYPKYGSLVAFEVNDLSYHGVEPVTGPASRATLAVYFLSKAGPDNTRQRALFIPNRSKK